MLRRTAHKPLAAVENALVRAAQHRGIHVLSIFPLGRLFRPGELPPGQDAVVLTVCRPDLSARLLQADLRLANVIPCRLAAIEDNGAVTIEALSAAEMCALIGRPELETALAPLEAMLAELLEAAAAPGPAATSVSSPSVYEPGATEGMVNSRAPIPQRIDCFGTKIEEIAGTGRHDAPGG